jgi:hypothetical protein
MSGFFGQLVGGVVDGALKEILRKTGAGAGKRKTRRTRAAASADKPRGQVASPSISGSVAKALARALAKSLAPKKQVSRRRTAAARSRQKTRS